MKNRNALSVVLLLLCLVSCQSSSPTAKTEKRDELNPYAEAIEKAKKASDEARANAVKQSEEALKQADSLLQNSMDDARAQLKNQNAEVQQRLEDADVKSRAAMVQARQQIDQMNKQLAEQNR